MPIKKGRMSNAERRFIRENAGKMSVEDMAAKLERTVDAVRDFVGDEVPRAAAAADEIFEIRQELRNSKSWKNLQLEFTRDELEYFEEGYIRLMSQFKGDVLPSEETQIFQAIKFEILMSRILKDRRRDLDQIAKLEQGRGKEKEAEINALRSVSQARTAEYTRLHEQHGSLMKSLKSTRDQRIREIESSRDSFLGVIKRLVDRDYRESEGRQLELMKMAGRKAADALSRPHPYADGSSDLPLLNADSVTRDQKESDEE